MRRLSVLVLAFFCFSFLSDAQTSFKGCPAIGKHKDGKKVGVREGGLNVRKNRGKKPTKIDHAITLQSLITAKEETDLDFNKAVQITAFVANVKEGEPGETCNCGRDDLHDVHIEVVAKESDKDNKRKYVIFEISPRFEAELGDTEEVKGKIEGKWVKFTGYLTYDYWHRGNSSNRKKKGNIWRATAWEVHPVTAYEVVPQP